jgi:hypothetical protein
MVRLRSDIFEVLRRHDVGEQCFAEVAMITEAAVRVERTSGKRAMSGPVVTQSDRDAAWKVWRSLHGVWQPWMATSKDSFLGGDWDTEEIVQAFARHRHGPANRSNRSHEGG